MSRTLSDSSRRLNGRIFAMGVGCVRPRREQAVTDLYEMKRSGPPLFLVQRGKTLTIKASFESRQLDRRTIRCFPDEPERKFGWRLPHEQNIESDCHWQQIPGEANVTPERVIAEKP